MATYTSYLNLEKPTTSETFNLLKMNQNWDKIDQGVSALNSKIKTVQIDGTTTSNGNLQLPITYWEGCPLAIKLKRTSDNGNIYAIVGRWGLDDDQGNWGCKCYGETEASGLQKSVDVTGVLYYYKL